MSTMDPDKLKELESEALTELDSINDLKQLEQWRIAYLGRKSSLSQVLRSLSQLPMEERREAGSKANRLKSLLEEKLSQKQDSLKKAELNRKLEESRIDVTLPGYPV